MQDLDSPNTCGAFWGEVWLLCNLLLHNYETRWTAQYTRHWGVWALYAMAASGELVLYFSTFGFFLIFFGTFKLLFGDFCTSLYFLVLFVLYYWDKHCKSEGVAKQSIANLAQNTIFLLCFDQKTDLSNLSLLIWSMGSNPPMTPLLSHFALGGKKIPKDLWEISWGSLLTNHDGVVLPPNTWGFYSV